MDTINKLLIGTAFSGIIILATASSYIPSSGGTLPPGESPEQFNNRQQQIIYNSTAFKATLIGASITVISMLTIWIRSLVSDCREDRINQRVMNEPRSILKVRRIMPQPVEIVVSENPREQAMPQRDLRPQVRTTPNFGATAPPSSSPPIQLIAGRGPVIEYIKFNRQ